MYLHTYILVTEDMLNDAWWPMTDFYSGMEQAVVRWVKVVVNNLVCGEMFWLGGGSVGCWVRSEERWQPCCGSTCQLHPISIANLFPRTVSATTVWSEIQNNDFWPQIP